MTSRKKRRRHEPSHIEMEPVWLDVDKELFAVQTRTETKTHQLCRQVEEAVSCALACANNRWIQDLYVVGVEPVRGAALLRVLVSTEESQDEYEQIQQALDSACGYFRGEVARSIHRKRTPSLEFVIVPSPDGERPVKNEE